MSYPKQKLEAFTNFGGMNTKVSTYVNGPNEFRNIENMNFTTPGSLTSRMGTTLFSGATVSGRISGLYEFVKLDGSSYLVSTANTNAYKVDASSSVSFKSGLANGALFSMVTLVDRLFACNGTDTFVYDGTSATKYSLPAGDSSFTGAMAAGGSLAAGAATFTFAYGYLNDRGYYGPVGLQLPVGVSGIAGSNSVTLSGLTTPTGFGITAIALYRTSSTGTDLFFTTFAPIGTTTLTDNGFPLSIQPATFYEYFTLAPRFYEIYNNQLYQAGVSSTPSTLYWSDVGIPEGVDSTFNAEVRTNDGDYITGLKSYQGALMVGKKKSLHQFKAASATDVLLQEVTDQYGVLSHRAMVVFEQQFWFLDQKGICEYNGANVQIVSTKIDPIFQAMNLTAAIDNAEAIHNKSQNEVWFSIPVGSTINNTIVVYDYVSKAFTTYKGVDVSTLTVARRALNVPMPFVGGYTGAIFNFNTDLTSDYPNSFTCIAKSRFFDPMGNSTEQMYRRFYLNISPITAATLTADINFYTNNGTSLQLTRTMYMNPYQSRIDFGLPARSIQCEFAYSSASYAIRLDGFVFENRFQRAV